MREEDLRRGSIAWTDVEDLPVKCPYQGEGQTISFSNTFVERYRGGVKLKAMCVALASADVRFDPKNGKRIKQYTLPGMMLPFTYPFYLTDCFRVVQIISGNESANTRWRPMGCTPRYDPATGRRVEGQKSIVLFTGGEAGGAPDPNDKTSSTVSSARLSDMLNGGD
jgi:hypothetical protein